MPMPKERECLCKREACKNERGVERSYETGNEREKPKRRRTPRLREKGRERMRKRAKVIQRK